MKNLLIIVCLLLFVVKLTAQEVVKKDTLKLNIPKKRLLTKIISDKITIDGKLSETAWETAETAKDFFTYDPDNGNPEPKTKRTEVKIVYDNDGIYIGAKMFDDEPEKILREISTRDNESTSDKFEIWINGNNDGQQDFRFFVSASDGQADCIFTNNNGEDFSWDAVWESKTTITDFGWVAEIKIPYSAIRFSSENKQIWGINFIRNIKRYRQEYSWNYIDKKVGNMLIQAGTLEGIENIKTPTRLFFLPYTSYYLNADAENKTKGTLKGGMDIKYGINDAFTLDAILIPDFGQTALDKKILNLGPFEQQFNENRSFFTEGTDLFNKGELLYTRRIGGRTFLQTKLSDNEELTENPANASLINATKISGRTKKGLGIGFLNAITENSYATIQDKTTGISRKQLVDPLSNFNIIVLDQRFRKNSSISFVNTNVTRDGEYRDANVSALVWDLKTKENTYGLQGNAKLSYINQLEDKTGISGGLEFKKLSGKYRYGFGSEIRTKDFDINDLGINNETNFYNFYANASYRILNPTKLFNNFTIRTNLYTEFQKNTGKLKSNEININTNITTKKNHGMGMGINFNPLEVYDYYGPQTQERFYIRPPEMSSWFYISTNYNNRFAIDMNPYFGVTSEKDRSYLGLNISPRYRFSDRMLVIYDFNYNQQQNDKGFVTNIDTDNTNTTPDDIIYARRDVKEFVNSLSGKYSLSSKMSLNLSVRHYWSYSENKNFFLLNKNGSLSDYNSAVENQNQDFSTWNFDLSYSWWFAPGSQISVLYRNNASNFSDNINRNFNKNLNNLLNNQALNNTLSISLKYFIDYNQAKHWF